MTRKSSKQDVSCKMSHLFSEEAKKRLELNLVSIKQRERVIPRMLRVEQTRYITISAGNKKGGFISCPLYASYLKTESTFCFRIVPTYLLIYCCREVLIPTRLFLWSTAKANITHCICNLKNQLSCSNTQFSRPDLINLHMLSPVNLMFRLIRESL